LKSIFHKNVTLSSHFLSTAKQTYSILLGEYSSLIYSFNTFVTHLSFQLLLKPHNTILFLLSYCT
jgi:hypothetical protein